MTATARAALKHWCIISAPYLPSAVAADYLIVTRLHWRPLALAGLMLAADLVIWCLLELAFWLVTRS